MKLFAKKSKNIEYFRSCSELWYYNFYKILETKNYAYLIKGWDEVSDIKFNKEKAFKVWQKIYNEYAQLRDDNKLLMHLEICSELVYLENRKYVVMTLAEMLSKGDKDRETLFLYSKEINEWGFRFNSNRPLVDELNRLYRQIRQVDNKIELLKDQKKSFEKEQGEEMPLMKIVVKVEQALGGSREVDPKKTTVEKWVYMIDEIIEVNKYRKKKAS